MIAFVAVMVVGTIIELGFALGLVSLVELMAKVGISK